MVASFIDSVKRFFRNGGVLKWLITINIGIFLIISLSGIFVKLSGIDIFSIDSFLSLPSKITDFLCRPWTIATYMFTQYNFLHILFNMLCLYWFGQVLLLTLSDRHLLWLYIVGGVFGGVFYLLIYNLVPTFSGVAAILCGSSASVLAIMVAAALRSPDYEMNLLLIGAVKLKWIAVVAIVMSVIGIGGNNSGGEIAHIGGLFAGMLFGLMLRRGKDITKIGVGFSSKNGNEAKTRKINASRTATVMTNHRDDMARLDELLDKIKQSGYKSLTRKERDELETLSKRLQK